ncbi:YitT family protein [Sphingosinicella sp. BN140058]|uniref:YitT family protein n=1 Tax=Sphingosinicella sp. BN140058 TaxID=1892855 RepID=UPI0010126EDD|nr:YitT family protein [Sphingosinicella sp. BN140058]QAY78666.1 YitT family protein [Sphingosinicella sp. BN140058]
MSPAAPHVTAGKPHSLVEDVYAFAIGCSFVVLGLVWLKSAGLVTGGMAGVALLLSYLVPLSPGMLFTLLNLPFLWLAQRSMGTAFMVRTALANFAITGLALLAPSAFRLTEVNGPFAALFGGTIIGMGILALARHHAGVGGLGIVALTLQRKRGWNAGRTSLIGDAFILAASLPVLAPRQFLLSVLSAAAISGVLIAYHKPGRYTGY